jgi:hypothetical protein
VNSSLHGHVKFPIKWSKTFPFPFKQKKKDGFSKNVINFHPNWFLCKKVGIRRGEDGGAK